VSLYSFDFSPSGSPGREGRRGSEGGQAEAAGKQSSPLNKEQQQKLYCYCTAYPRELFLFLKKELRGLSPNFHNQVSVSDLHTSTVDLPILLAGNMWADPA
jgi:hypothetical protein